MTLYAPNAFPGMATGCSADVLTGCGFSFPAGQHSITFDDVTVTDVQATRCYGGARGHAQTGNIGFASVTFGDSAGVLTTEVMPILFYFKVTANATQPKQCDDSGAVVDVPPQQGWFGVNTAADGLVVGGLLATTQSPLCTNGGSSTCRVVSVFNYLQYADAVDAGFLLQHQILQPCSIDSGTCVPEPMLTVGLTTTQTADLDSTALECSSAPPLQKFPTCSPIIATSEVTVSETAGSSMASYFNSETLFDSGTPNMILAPTSGVTLPTTVNQTDLETIIGANESVLITLSSGYQITYGATSAGVDETIVNPGGIGNNIVGIDFFQQHDFYIDFTTTQEGWR